MAKNKNSSSPDKNTVLLYGRHPVFAAIANPSRRILKIYASAENAAEIKAHLSACQRNNLPLQIVDRKDIDKMLPREAVHQGFALLCKELENYSIEDICTLAAEKKDCHILILDQVTDPQNIGAIIRSCVAFDTLALIMQDKNAPAETGAMAKASAGMIELLPICRVINLSRALVRLKQDGFWILGMDGYAQTTIDQINKSGKTAIVMGSEGKGMRRLVEENCDSSVKLPISSKVESLNVATAAAIALYEINRR